MNRKRVLKKATQVLKKVFLKYKKEGIISIYLWGSVLCDDFNPEKSDIDTIAIVRDNFKPETITKINQLLSEEQTGLKEFKINYLFLGELAGKKPKSRLAKALTPNLLLSDFPTWKHVAGKKFSRSDFPLKEWTREETLKYRIKRFYKIHIVDVKKGDYSKIKYLCKNLFRVCHLVNEINKKPHLFEYKTLIRNSNKETKSLIVLLLKLQKSDWDQELFKKNLPRLLNLVNKINKNY